VILAVQKILCLVKWLAALLPVGGLIALGTLRPCWTGVPSRDGHLSGDR
jgi:hypothetical protein